jgi:hypothetical protein
MNIRSKNIVSGSPNHSEKSVSASSTHSIGAYIEKVFKKPYSTSLSSSSSSSSSCTWELPTPSSSSSSERSSLPKPTLSSPSSSSTSEWEWEWPSNYLECDGNDSSGIPSTDEWFNHRLAAKTRQKKTQQRRYALKRDSLRALLGIF